jgi:hypothetical protein
MFPPMVGSPGADPHGRGEPGAVDIFGLGASFITIIMALMGGWIASILSHSEIRTFDNIASACIFLALSGITVANYASVDILITRDAQALMNVLLACAGATLVAAFQATLMERSSKLLLMLGSALLALFIYAFVAIPLWFTFSYVSWKTGAGKLDSLETAAKMISAAASILTVAGLAWKVKTSDQRKSTDS